MRNLWIIPAREGSRAVPHKNRVIFDGESLACRAVGQAVALGDGDVVFSSDDIYLINEVSVRFGTSVIIHERPKVLATAETLMADVVGSVIESLGVKKDIYSHLFILQPTSPFRSTLDLEDAVRGFDKASIDSIVSLSKYEGTHPARMYFDIENGNLEPVAPQIDLGRRQEYPPVLVRNGAIFACTTKYFFSTGKLFGGKMGYVLIPIERSLDIDNPQDLEQFFTMISPSVSNKI